MVRGLKDGAEFDATKLDGYRLEVIGGNHRCEAYSQLVKEGKIGKSSPLLLTVHLYTGMFHMYQGLKNRRTDVRLYAKNYSSYTCVSGDYDNVHFR